MRLLAMSFGSQGWPCAPPCLLACAPALPGDLRHHLPEEEGSNVMRCAQFDCSARWNIAKRYSHDRFVTRARSPIATRLFDVHLGFRRTSVVVIDLMKRATAPGDAHQLGSIDITAVLARRRRRTRARSLWALLCTSAMRSLDDGTDRGACFACQQVASRQLT